MGRAIVRGLFVAILPIVFLISSARAQTLDVKIVNRQQNETEYTYVAPGYYNSSANARVNCSGGSTSVNCSGSAATSGWDMPAHEVSFRVRGATFSLQLPDGRIAVVNCESKFAERFAGPRGNRRSCRMPLVDNIQAEFKGNDAKLKWPVSLDGKKLESETYKILAVFDK
jgi:hypothetical protein